MAEGSPITPDEVFAKKLDDNCDICLGEGIGVSRPGQISLLRVRAITHESESVILRRVMRRCLDCNGENLTVSNIDSCAWRGNP